MARVFALLAAVSACGGEPHYPGGTPGPPGSIGGQALPCHPDTCAADCWAGGWGGAACAGDTDCDCSAVALIETCADGQDNDADGQVDEGCPCAAGSTQSCYSGLPATRGRGICRDGGQSCLGPGDGELSGWGFCAGERLPEDERCDDKDNNCNGTIDEGCPGEICTSQCDCCRPGTERWCDDPTFCSWGTQACLPDGTWGACAETPSRPAGCGSTFYDLECCLAAAECCEDASSPGPGPGPGASVGRCAGITATCR